MKAITHGATIRKLGYFYVAALGPVVGCGITEKAAEADLGSKLLQPCDGCGRRILGPAEADLCRHLAAYGGQALCHPCRQERDGTYGPEQELDEEHGR